MCDDELILRSIAMAIFRKSDVLPVATEGDGAVTAKALPRRQHFYLLYLP